MGFEAGKWHVSRQQTVLLFASFLVGIITWLTFIVLFRGSQDQAESKSSNYQNQIQDDFDADIPQPQFSPSDVVTLQVNSIRDAVGDRAKLKVCYSLASPENRKHTGPFQRFAEIVMLPPYDRLATCIDWQVGGAVIDKDLAAVLVSTITLNGEVSGFRFILKRQASSMRKCWLTEGVQLLEEELVDLTQDTGNELDRKLE